MKNIIIGAHSIIYSTNPEADRAFLRDVLELSHVDVGDGWLIFGLPPAEIAIHPSDTNNVHELYLMCGDIEALIEKLKPLNIDCEPVQRRKVPQGECQKAARETDEQEVATTPPLTCLPPSPACGRGSGRVTQWMDRPPSRRANTGRRGLKYVRNRRTCKC